MCRPDLLLFRIRRCCLIAALVWLSISLPTAASAQNSADSGALSLEDLLNVEVSSASKYAQNAAEAPSSVTVITAEEIEKNGYRSLVDILGSMTGFYVRTNGNYKILGVRGFAPQDSAGGRILLLINGHAINDNIDDAAPIEDTFPIDLDLIDRIEVVRGPNSSLYGADAFFGVVNVITRTGASTRGAVVSADAGTYGTYKQSATYGTERGGTQALLSESYSTSNVPGQLDHIADPVGSTSDRDQSRRLFGLASSHGFTLQGALSAVEQKVPTSSQWCGSCHQTSGHSTDYRGYVDAQYHHTFGKNTDIVARTYYDKLTDHTNSNVLRGCSETSCHGQVLDHYAAHGDRAGIDLKVTQRFLDRFRITAGAEYRDNFRQQQQNWIDGYQNTHGGGMTTQETFVGYNRTSSVWGLYGEAEAKVSKQLILSAGLRNDRYNYIGSSYNPRVSVIYNPRKSTTLKYFFGTAFRAPSFNEMYYSSMFSASAPALQAETIRTQEVVLEQAIGRKYRVNVAGFYNHIGNYIEQQILIVKGQDQTTYANSQAQAKGFEVELSGKLPSKIQAGLSYTYQDVRNPLTDASLLDSPRHLEKLSVSRPLFRNVVWGNVEAQYMSRCLVAPFRDLGTPNSYSGVPVLLNATIYSRDLWRGFSLSGSVYNLVDRPIGDPVGDYTEQNHTIPMASILPDDRRTYRIKLTWTSGRESSKHQKAADVEIANPGAGNAH